MTYESTYLCHHGIKGQKWGIRRFVDADGSLTSAGRKRYDKEVNNYQQLITSKFNKAKMDYPTVQGIKKHKFTDRLFAKSRDKKQTQIVNNLVNQRGLQDSLSSGDIKHLKGIKNAKLRQQVLDDMAKNPKGNYNMTYNKRLWTNLLANAAISAGSSIVSGLIAGHRDQVMNVIDQSMNQRLESLMNKRGR